MTGILLGTLTTVVVLGVALIVRRLSVPSLQDMIKSFNPRKK